MAVPRNLGLLCFGFSLMPLINGSLDLAREIVCEYCLGFSSYKHGDAARLHLAVLT
jgi:hypothetical protein